PAVSGPLLSHRTRRARSERARARLLRCVQQRVEHQLERAVGLVTVLWTETNQHDPAFPIAHDRCRGLVRDDLLAEEPAALKDVAVDVARDDLDVLAAIGGRHLIDLAA